MKATLRPVLAALLERDDIDPTELAYATRMSPASVNRRERGEIAYTIEEYQYAAEHYRLNLPRLLVELGVLNYEDVEEYLNGESGGLTVDRARNYELAEELARRLAEEERGSRPVNRNALHKAESDAAAAVEASLNTVGRTARQENRLQG